MLTDIVLAVVIPVVAALSSRYIDSHCRQIAQDQCFVKLHCSQPLRLTAARPSSDQCACPGSTSIKARGLYVDFPNATSLEIQYEAVEILDRWLFCVFWRPMSE